MRNNQKKNFSQLARTNPTLAALNIVTRKELKMEEMQEKLEQEDQSRPRHKSGSTTQEEQTANAPSSSSSFASGQNSSSVNSGVLQTFRELSIHKGPQNTHSASRQAAIAAKKASTPVKPEMTKSGSMSREVPAVTSSNTDLAGSSQDTPVVVLRKQPRILEPEELKARTSSVGQSGPASGRAGGGEEAASSALNNVSLVQETEEEGTVKHTSNKVSHVARPDNHNISPPSTQKGPTFNKGKSEQTPSSNGTERRLETKAESVPVPKQKIETQKASQSVNGKDNIRDDISVEQVNVPKQKTDTDKVAQAVNRKDSRAEAAIEKVNAARQKIENQKGSQSVKQNLEGLVHVKPKQEAVKAETAGVVSEESQTAQAAPKMVRRAAEKFEANITELNNKDFSSSLGFSSNIRGRSKSISDKLREQMVSAGSSGSSKEPSKLLPWSGRSPPVLRRRDNRANKNFALQMSKSSDSITAAKLLAKARAESFETGNSLRINSNFSKSIQQQLDVYSKTKDEIRQILSLAKAGSVNDRISLFSNMMDTHRQPAGDPNEKAEAIRREIEEAKAARAAEVQETVSDTEIEFQEPIESKVKPLKIPMKPKILNSPASPASGLRINQSRRDVTSPKKDRRPSIEELPSVKSKIKTYISATSEEEPQPVGQATPKPILRKTSSSLQEPTLTPILKRREGGRDLLKERSRSPKKKTPKLVSDQFLSTDQSLKIYTLSATDVSATEDEAEHSSRSVKAKRHQPLQVVEDAGPTRLSIPAKSVTESRPGVVKSKSFANPGQFECSVEESAGRKMQMLSFFSDNNKKETKAKTRASVADINDDIDMGEDDLVDIDAEFESLLTKTFEKESRHMSGGKHNLLALVLRSSISISRRESQQLGVWPSYQQEKLGGSGGEGCQSGYDRSGY